MTMTINNRKFDVTVKATTTWTSTISVYEIFEDGHFEFMGKAITNDIEKAIVDMM